MTEIISRATIYLGDKRGCTQSNGYRSFHTFNFGNYQNEHRKGYGSLTAFNDETLVAKSSIVHGVVEDGMVLLIPIVGGIEFEIKEGDRSFIEAGESVLFSVTKGCTLEIANPLNDEPVNFVSAWFSPDVFSPDLNTQSVFNLDDQKDSLIHLFSFRSIEGRLGMFSGRKDAAYELQNYSGALFAFVIEGAFEFQNRLLESRDGLLLLNVQRVEFEALSSDAIVLLLEV